MSQINNECNPELVSAFLDNELDQIIVGLVAKHLLRCDDCCKTMSRLAQISSVVSGQFALCEPETLTQSVMLAISNEKSISPRDRLTDRFTRFGIPFMLAGVISSQVMAATVDVEDYAQQTEIIG